MASNPELSGADREVEPLTQNFNIIQPTTGNSKPYHACYSHCHSGRKEIPTGRTDHPSYQAKSTIS